MSPGLMVTGTDTGVGKTLVAAGLCAWLRGQGYRVRGFKPVESGTDDNGGVPGDAALLAQCSGVGVDRSHVYALSEPLAPVLAARRQGIVLQRSVLDARVAELVEESDVLVVEGVGGALVEVLPGLPVADLAAAWQLPALVVAANRLGVLSHTLLTVEALLGRGVSMRGVVLSTLRPGRPNLAEATNAAELERLLPAGVELLAVCPWIPEEDRTRPEALAAAVAPWARRAFDKLD